MLFVCTGFWYLFCLFVVFIPAYFIRPFYKMVLGKGLALNDMESVVSMHIFADIFVTEVDIWTILPVFGKL